MADPIIISNGGVTLPNGSSIKLPTVGDTPPVSLDPSGLTGPVAEAAKKAKEAEPGVREVIDNANQNYFGQRPSGAAEAFNTLKKHYFPRGFGGGYGPLPDPPPAGAEGTPTDGPPKPGDTNKGEGQPKPPLLIPTFVDP